jgi:hypothetical protein
VIAPFAVLVWSGVYFRLREAERRVFEIARSVPIAV